MKYRDERGLEVEEGLVDGKIDVGGRVDGGLVKGVIRNQGETRASEARSEATRGQWRGRWVGGGIVVVSMMEICPMHYLGIICVLHYGDRRSD